ncbi:hypothetical protein MKX03_033990 [Papaver bracteatum]|nr:hypothetical protein MKX03_033990 [Papaver bracteatum]
MENPEGEAITMETAIRCAKALSVISSIKDSQLHELMELIDKEEEEGNEHVDELELLRTAADLRLRLVEEREKMNIFKHWGLLELKYQMLLVFFLLVLLVLISI